MKRIFIFAEGARFRMCALPILVSQFRQITILKDLIKVLTYLTFSSLYFYQSAFTKNEEYQNSRISLDKIHDVSATTIARWPKAWRVDQPVDECVYVGEGRPRDPLNHTITIPFTRP